MTCYYPGCDAPGTTKEHIPPKSFFPDDERDQLLTVRSCEKHNNRKSKDDLYVLAQICLNASPHNRAREIFELRVKPQLGFNNGALRKRLAKGSVINTDGSVGYRVQVSRLDDFFDHLCFGLIFKACKASLPKRYKIRHIYHSLSGTADLRELQLQNELLRFYSAPLPEILDFGTPGTVNTKIYRARITGVPHFQSSITITHTFFGKFLVTSMLSNIIGNEQGNNRQNKPDAPT
ncbi:hypothetical protein [Albimonas donghaensis]|uniref:hypothetical protein n=1 Tax=Albimonas donghaensis TaxID=356660 RepID=UPI000B88DD59|nr:hypothetical protein [Albimonas donghaensis]